MVNGQYAYLMWVLLLQMQTQYPGVLGIFKSTLAGMQHFSAVQVMNWVQGQVVERILSIAIILYGRWYGLNHPEMGMLMGIVIFGVIGYYVDDILMWIVSGFYLNKILKKYMGHTLTEVLAQPIGKDVKRDAVQYGITGSLLPILSSAVGTYALIAYSSEIGGYITWVALLGRSAGFTGIMGQFGDFGLSTNVAESYMSGKKELAQYYVSASLRWRYFFRVLMGMAIFAVIPYLKLMVAENEGLLYYERAFDFLVFYIIKSIIQPLLQLVDPIMYGANKINQQRLIRTIEQLFIIGPSFGGLW